MEKEIVSVCPLLPCQRLNCRGTRRRLTACKKPLCITLLAKPSIRFVEFGVLGNEHATMLLGYSFAVRPNSRALGTAGSVMTIFGLLINRCTHSKNQLEESKQDWLGCGDVEGLRTRFRQSVLSRPPRSRRGKKALATGWLCIRFSPCLISPRPPQTNDGTSQTDHDAEATIFERCHRFFYPPPPPQPNPLEVYGWRRQGQLVIANTQWRDNHGRHDLSLWRFDVGRYSRLCNVTIFNSLRKRPIFRDAISGFPSRKWRLRNERRNSILMTCHYPDLGSALDWSCSVGNLLQPIAGTTQFWIVTCHQYQGSHCFKPLKFLQDLFKFSMTF